VWRHITNKKKKHASCVATKQEEQGKEFRACWRLTEASARPFDAGIATAASHFIGVFFACAWCLAFLRILEDPHWIRGA